MVLRDKFNCCLTIFRENRCGVTIIVIPISELFQIFIMVPIIYYGQNQSDKDVRDVLVNNNFPENVNKGIPEIPETRSAGRNRYIDLFPGFTKFSILENRIKLIKILL